MLPNSDNKRIRAVDGKLNKLNRKHAQRSFGLKTEPTQLQQTISGQAINARAPWLHHTEQNMQKRLAILLVLALVIAVANFPTAQGFSGGTGTWKRALQVGLNFYIPWQFVYRLLWKQQTVTKLPFVTPVLDLTSRKWPSQYKIRNNF